MFKIVKIILIFIIFFYFLRTFTHNIFPTIEGMCMDGDTELGSSITKDECGEGGFTWKEPGSDDDAGDDAGDDADCDDADSDAAGALIESFMSDDETTALQELAAETQLEMTVFPGENGPGGYNTTVPLEKPPVAAQSEFLNNSSYMGVVNGWNQKIHSSSQAISSLVPLLPIFFHSSNIFSGTLKGS